jgi:adenosylmethionine-8-amino-7-oxononanoate aminotransferase
VSRLRARHDLTPRAHPLARAAVYPMTNLHAPAAMQIVSGKGCRVTDEHGRVHLEGMSGLWCTGLGWGNEELIAAAAEQMRTLSYYHCYARSSPWTYELAERLLKMAPAAAEGHSFEKGRVFFGTGGSDGNDTQVRARAGGVRAGAEQRGR